MSLFSRTTLNNWLYLCRPKTLWVGICPCLLASSISIFYKTFNLTIVSICLIVSILIQIGCNLANDYFDFKKGADIHRVGPKRLLNTQSNITPKHIKIGFITCLSTAFILGLYLIYLGGWIIGIIGVSAICMAVLYTAGPYALAYTGFADLIAFLYFGPVATTGILYLLKSSTNAMMTGLAFGIGLGCYSVAILTVNNLRDRIQDKKVNKKHFVFVLVKSLAEHTTPCLYSFL